MVRIGVANFLCAERELHFVIYINIYLDIDVDFDYKKKQSCFWKQLRFADKHNVSSVGASKADFDVCYCYSPVVGMVFCTKADLAMNVNLIMTALELLIIDCNRKLQVNPSTLYQNRYFFLTFKMPLNCQELPQLLETTSC